MSDSTHQVTQLLQAWSEGNALASEELLPLIYERLRRMARSFMRQERVGHTLQPTALVHEAFLQLGGAEVSWQNRVHFYSLAARAMRRILVNHAVARSRLKRGGGQERVSLTHAEELSPAPAQGVDLIELDHAMEQLSEIFPRQSRVVELRFFGGMQASDIAESLKVSEKTVLRDWQFAKLWLRRKLAENN